MLIAYQVILLVIILIGFLWMIGEKEDINLRHNLTAVCISAILAFVVSVWLL